MAVLSSAQRKKLPKTDFGLPAEDKYPMPDWTHAADAKSRAQGQFNAGKMSKAKRDKIFAKANGVMGKEKS